MKCARLSRSARPDTESLEILQPLPHVGGEARGRLLYARLTVTLRQSAQHVEPGPLQPVRDVGLLRPEAGGLHADEHPAQPVERDVWLAAGRTEAVLRIEVVARR